MEKPPPVLWLESFFYTALIVSGRLAAKVKFGKVSRVGDFYRKRRRLYAPFLVAVANSYLWLTRGGLRILPGREWLCWEQEVWARVGRVARVRGLELITAELPGQPVSVVLRSSRSAGKKEAALVGALEALHELHHLHGLTHSDAATHNVYYDARTGRAHWFDFESRHHGKSASWSRAQDLVAFLCSASTMLPGAELSLLRAWGRGYPDAGLRRKALELLDGWKSQPVMLQQVQAPWSYGRMRALRQVLQS